MDSSLTRYEALLACLDKAGSVSQLGRDLCIPQSTMWRIVHQSKQLPAEYVLRAEELYGVSRHYLRPDIYPFESAGASAPRWSGIDQSAAIRVNGLDRQANGVPFNSNGISQRGAA